MQVQPYKKQRTCELRTSLSSHCLRKYSTTTPGVTPNRFSVCEIQRFYCTTGGADGNHLAEWGLQNCGQLTPSVGTLTPKQADQQSRIAIFEEEMRDGLLHTTAEVTRSWSVKKYRPWPSGQNASCDGRQLQTSGCDLTVPQTVKSAHERGLGLVAKLSGFGSAYQYSGRTSYKKFRAFSGHQFLENTIYSQNHSS